MRQYHVTLFAEFLGEVEKTLLSRQEASLGGSRGRLSILSSHRISPTSQLLCSESNIESYLSNIRPQQRKLGLLPFMLLPCLEYLSQLLHHSCRISMASVFLPAEHTSNSMGDLLFNLTSSPDADCILSQTLARGKYGPGLCSRGSIHQCPV
jgi:hypothetical protein